MLVQLVALRGHKLHIKLGYRGNPSSLGAKSIKVTKSNKPLTLAYVRGLFV
jgi:hypothetical protein